MEFKIYIEEFLNALKNGDKNKAIKVKVETVKEIERLEKIHNVNKTGKTALKSLREIVCNVEHGDLEKVQVLWKETHKQFNEHLRFYLKQIKEVEQLPDYESNGKHNLSRNEDERQNLGSHRQRPYMNSSDNGNNQTNHPSKPISNSQVHTGNETKDVQRQTHTSTEDRQPYKTNERRNSVKTHDDNNAFKIQKSKMASQAMRHNNPDIADLSDTNRPTKIAERFSELYDNEWTEAFEELGKKSFTEEKAIQCLWALVKEAYKLCSKTSEAQIKGIAKVFERIIVLGPDSYADQKLYTNVQPQEGHEDKHLLIQYRKEIASESLPQIEKEFLETTRNKRRGMPSTMPAVEQFSKKVVEVVWWMCVQDPPVYMCLSKDIETFDQSLYKAYTKSGTIPAFFVWPALRLYRNGGVLMKGVVQYK